MNKVSFWKYLSKRCKTKKTNISFSFPRNLQSIQECFHFCILLKWSQKREHNTSINDFISLCKKKCPRSATLSKKRLWHSCFPVKFAKFVKAPFLQNTNFHNEVSYKPFSDKCDKRCT